MRNIFRVASRCAVALIAAVAYGVIGWLAGVVVASLLVGGIVESHQTWWRIVSRAGRDGFILFAIVGLILSYCRTWASEDRRGG
jgi:hypothetical protein